MSPPKVPGLFQRMSGLAEQMRYAPGAMVRDGVKQAVNSFPGGRSALDRVRHTVRRRRPLVGPLVLMYHRIAEQDPDPWSLSVSPENFAAQMEVLAKRRRPLALTQFVRGGKVAEIPADAVAVTFDDGYADNLLAAKPVLERYGIPATVFVTSIAVDHPGELWWDELEHLLLAPDRLPPKISLTLGGREVTFSHDSNSSEMESDRRAAFVARGGSRWLLYEAVYQALLAAPHAEKVRALQELAVLVGRKSGGPWGRRLLQAAELRQLASGNLIEIGCHTETHPVLATLSRENQQIEIARNKAFLEELLEHPISSFSYPYGSYDATTIICLRHAGFRLACHTRTKPVERNASPFELPRLHVQDWDGDQALRVLAPRTHDRGRVALSVGGRLE